MKKGTWNLILSDWQRYVEHKEISGRVMALIINAITCKNHRAAFSFWMRIRNSCKRFTPIWFISRMMYKRISKRYGLQIPYSTDIGKGLYIGHGIGIVINGKTKIGDNCNISQFLTIGSNKGTPATIGDNVYIGPNVCIVEDVKIGDNVKIGAGTVVVHNVPSDCTTVGNPNRTIYNKR